MAILEKLAKRLRTRRSQPHGGSGRAGGLTWAWGGAVLVPGRPPPAVERAPSPKARQKPLSAPRQGVGMAFGDEHAALMPNVVPTPLQVIHCISFAA